MKSTFILLWLFLTFTPITKADLVESAAFGTFRDDYASGSGFQFASTLGVTSGIYPSLDASGLEDRAAIEFDLSSLSGPYTSAELDLTVTINNGDTSIPLSYDLYSYVGDGIVDSSSTGDVLIGRLWGRSKSLTKVSEQSYILM
ncbi:MAG: hypothetical protein R3B91_17445 [Planctomycetaceae bacterium]